MSKYTARHTEALFHSTTLFRSGQGRRQGAARRPPGAGWASRWSARRVRPLGAEAAARHEAPAGPQPRPVQPEAPAGELTLLPRSEEHTSELQSRSDLVCRLLRE